MAAAFKRTVMARVLVAVNGGLPPSAAWTMILYWARASRSSTVMGLTVTQPLVGLIEKPVPEWENNTQGETSWIKSCERTKASSDHILGAAAVLGCLVLDLSFRLVIFLPYLLKKYIYIYLLSMNEDILLHAMKSLWIYKANAKDEEETRTNSNWHWISVCNTTMIRESPIRRLQHPQHRMTQAARTNITRQNITSPPTIE